MQHVTRVVGSSLEHRRITKGKISFSETQSDDRNTVTIQNVTFNHHCGLIRQKGHISLKRLPHFILKRIQFDDDVKWIFCINLLN